MKRPLRLALVVLGLALLIGGGWLSAGVPRLTLLNSALRIDYPWKHGAFAFVCALGGFLLAFLITKPTLRRVALVIAAGPLLLAIHLLAFRLEVAPAALSFRGLFGTSTIAWPDVARIDLEAGAIAVEAKSGTSVRIDTTDFAADQRAAVERALARHVQENGGPTPRVVIPQ